MSTIYWVVTPWYSERPRRFRVPYRLHLQGRRVNQATNLLVSCLSCFSTLTTEAIYSCETLGSPSELHNAATQDVLFSHCCDNLNLYVCMSVLLSLVPPEISADMTLRGSAICFNANRNSVSLAVKNNPVRLEFGFKKRVRDPQIELPRTGLRLMVGIIEKVYISVFQMWAWGRFRFLLVKRQDSETRERKMHSLLNKKKKKEF